MAADVFCIVQAFLAASLKTDEELLGWFNERLVWNDQGVVSEMLKNGLFVRIFAPQVCHNDNRNAHQESLSEGVVKLSGKMTGTQQHSNFFFLLLMCLRNKLKCYYTRHTERVFVWCMLNAKMHKLSLLVSCPYAMHTSCHLYCQLLSASCLAPNRTCVVMFDPRC